MKTKLKDLKYEINGTETNKPGVQLLYGCITGLVLALVGLFLLVTFAEQIDQFAEDDIDNSLALVIIFFGAVGLIIFSLKKWVL